MEQLSVDFREAMAYLPHALGKVLPKFVVATVGNGFDAEKWNSEAAANLCQGVGFHVTHGK
jgi:hypothetical protein